MHIKRVYKWSWHVQTIPTKQKHQQESRKQDSAVWNCISHDVYVYMTINDSFHHAHVGVHHLTYFVTNHFYVHFKATAVKLSSFWKESFHNMPQISSTFWNSRIKTVVGNWQNRGARKSSLMCKSQSRRIHGQKTEILMQ